MATITQELQANIDQLDGVEGQDTTGLEAKLSANVLALSPEKQQEAARRFAALTRVNTELQSAYQKKNLLEGMKAVDSNIFVTIAQIEHKKMRVVRFAQIKEGKGGSSDPKEVDDRKKILEKADSFEKIRASDVLFLKKKGADLTSLLLIPENNTFGSVSRENLKEKDSFIVNFGDNKNLNDIVGAGDILPINVSKIRVNGVEGERKNRPRPGYFDAKGKYLPVFDGDKIEIVTLNNYTSESEQKEAHASEDAWLRDRRIADMADSDGKAFSTLDEDMQLEKDAQEEIKRRKESGADFSPEDSIDNGENLKGNELWENAKFQTKLGEVCKRLGVDKEDMKIVMRAESGINPKRVNRISGATGLIQFMPKTARGLGTTVSVLRHMTSVDQLDYVEKYFAPYSGKLNSVRDLYLATFYPAAIGKDQYFVLGSQSGSGVLPEKIARDNWIIAPGKDVITVADFDAYVERKKIG